MKHRAPRRTSALLLGLILAGHALLWWTHPFDFLDEIDSQHYARIAAEILEGEFTLTAHPFYDRLGVTVPTAVVYGVLGVSSRTTTLWTLLASLLTIVTVFATTTRISGRSAGLLAAFLLAANPIQVEYTPHLLPDVIASAFMVAAAALLYWARHAPIGSSGRLWLRGGLCALTLVAGVLVKKTAFWAFPFFAVILAVDLARRRNVRLWTAIVATGTALLGLFCLSYYLATGDPLRALASIETTHNVSPLASFYGGSGAEYLHRLTLEPLQFIVLQLGYGFPLALGAAALVTLARPSLSMPSGVRFWAGYTAIVILCFWFGTTSLRSYNPLPVSTRHMVPLLAPLAILGGIVLGAFLFPERREPLRQLRIPATVATLAAAAAALWWSLPQRSAVYALLGLTLVLLGWPRLRRPLHGRIGRMARAAIAVALPLALLLPHEMRSEVKEPNSLRVRQRRFVRVKVGRLPRGTVVFTDDHSAFVVPLLLEYRDKQNHLRLVDWNDETAVRAHAGAPAYLFLDQTTLSMMNEWYGREIPWFAPLPPRHWPRVATQATRWKGSGPDRSERPFPVAWIALLRIDEPTELLDR